LGPITPYLEALPPLKEVEARQKRDEEEFREEFERTVAPAWTTSTGSPRWGRRLAHPQGAEAMARRAAFGHLHQRRLAPIAMAAGAGPEAPRAGRRVQARAGDQPV